VLLNLRPLFALFVRSLREQSRTKLTHFARGGIGLLLLLLIWKNERSFLSQTASGLFVLTMVVMVNFFAIGIFGLSTFASAIAEEKEDDTLGLLRMTRLNPLSILLGKGTARLCEGLLLLAVQVPFSMLCITLGGVSLEQVLHCYAILAAFLFLLSNVALFWSVVCRSSGRAGVLTATTFIVLYLLPWFALPRSVIRSLAGGTGNLSWIDRVGQFLMGSNPVLDLARVIDPRGGGFFTASDSVLPSLVGGALAFALAWMLFGKFCNAGSESAPKAASASPSAKPRRRRRVPRTGRNAIAWKDFHFLNGGWSALRIRCIVYLGVVGLQMYRDLSLFSGLSGRRDFEWRALGFVLLQFGIMSFSVELGLAASRLFGIERKRNTLGSLCTLPISTGRLIWQKILGGLPVLAPSVLLGLLGFLSFASAPGRWLPREPVAYLVIILSISEYLLFAVLSMFLSLRMRRGAFAAAVGLMFIGNFLLTLMLATGGGAGSGEGAFVVLIMFVWMTLVPLALAIPSQIKRAGAGE